MQDSSFSEVEKWLLDNGFLLGFEQMRDPSIVTQGRFHIYIHPFNHVVISIQESINSPNSIEDCHLLCSWQLKTEYFDQKSDFIDYVYGLGGKTPSFYNHKHKTEDVSIIQIESYANRESKSVSGLYLLLAEKAIFLPWKEQPHMWLLTNEEWLGNDIDNTKISNKKLRSAIKKLDLNLVDFGLLV